MDRLFSGGGGGGANKSRNRPVFDLGDYETPGTSKRNVHNLSQWWAVAIVLGFIGLSAVSKYQLLSLPRALTANDEANHRDSFIAERARVDLRILNDFGPRPTGSRANEVHAVDFLKRELAHIQANAHPAQKLYADVQRVSGSYYAAFKPHGMTNGYRDVQNVVAKLVGERERSGAGNETLMLNCHFDSVAGSPGASDDAASCCVMLEVLRVLAKQPQVLRHSVLMLFNGAEETPLQASHGFITQHRWAGQVRAFLNLESVGSNGKEILFQAGPEHAWLIEMYRAVAPHPSGHVAGEEIFQSGLIPSDTDFRIFRDHGHVPGMDFAHVLNGYRYHTRFDSIDYLPAAVLQRTGDNILALVRRIASSDELEHTGAYASSGRAVYFDVLGLWMVAYDERWGELFNVVVSLLAIALPFAYLRRATRGTNVDWIRGEMALGAWTPLPAAAVSLAVTQAIAWEVDASGHALVWYHHTLFAAVLYALPTVIVMVLAQRLSGWRRRTPLSAGLVAQARLAGVNMLLAVGALAGSWWHVRSAYVCMVPMLISVAVAAVVGVLGWANSIRKWLYVHLIGQALFVLWATNYYHLITGMFIPIAGRSGSFDNPEVLLAGIVWLLTVYATLYLVPLVGLLRRCGWFVVGLVAVFVVTRWGCISMTMVGFPYRGDAVNPTPQRHFITHTIRTVYDANGEIAYTDSGFYFRDIDRNAHKTLESLVAPDLLQPQEQNPLCQKRPFCGLPYYSCRQLHSNGFWLPGPAPILRDEAHLVNTTRSPIADAPNDFHLNFTITGQVLLSLQLQTKPGVRLVDWTLSDTGIPEPNVFQQREQYFVMMTHGLAAEPQPVSLRLRTSDLNAADAPLIDVSLVTYHWEYHSEHTGTFAGLLAKMPDWTFTVPSVASVQSWTF